MPRHAPGWGDRRRTALIGAAVLALLALAWISGGEQPVRTVEIAVPLPEGAL